MSGDTAVEQFPSMQGLFSSNSTSISVCLLLSLFNHCAIISQMCVLSDKAANIWCSLQYHQQLQSLDPWTHLVSQFCACLFCFAWITVFVFCVCVCVCILCVCVCVCILCVCVCVCVCVLGYNNCNWLWLAQNSGSAVKQTHKWDTSCGSQIQFISTRARVSDTHTHTHTHRSWERQIKCVCVCVCVWGKDRVIFSDCMCVLIREVKNQCVCVCVDCVCVCVMLGLSVVCWASWDGCYVCHTPALGQPVHSHTDKPANTQTLQRELSYNIHPHKSAKQQLIDTSGFQTIQTHTHTSR